jgi:capsid assembly protease
MNVLPHVAARLFGAPLLIHRPKLDVILAVLGPRVGLTDLAAPVGYVPPDRTTPSTNPTIAVIPIHGTLVRRTVGLEAESGLASYAAIAGQLDAALANPNTAAILLDIDSPGGESSGVFDLADRIRTTATSKPVWAVANDMAFSAAYALASGASRIFVSRTGGVGSIGVIAMHVDQSVKDAQDGVHYTAVFAGDRKNDLNPHEPISDEAHAFLQSEVNRVYGLFVETVAKHRGLKADAIKATEAGLFFGKDAISAGLADAVGTFDDAILQLTQTISSRPKLATAGTGSRGASFNLTTELPMNDLSDPAATDRSAADPAGSNPEPTAPATMTIADAVEIAQTCSLAGRTDLTAGFLEARVSPAKVRSQLLAAQADNSPEIVSRISPDATASITPTSNPLVDAAKQLAAKSASLKKEF